MVVNLMSNFKQIPDTDYEEIIDEMKVNNISIKELEKLVNNILQSLPILNKNELRAEMQQMIVNVPENPTTFDINKGLSLSQGYRDRLSEIYIDVMKETKIRKRCLEMLLDANNLISKASSVDKRRGEATLKYPMQLLQYENIDSFLKEVEQILNNMKATFDTFSRAGSILALQVQLGEYKHNLKSNSFNNFESEAEEIKKEPIQEMKW